MYSRGTIDDDDDDLHSSTTTTVAVAVDKDKNSQQAVKWAVDNFASKDTVAALVHVKTQRGCGNNETEGSRRPTAADQQLAAFLRPFRILFARKGVKVVDAVLENGDVPFAIVQYIKTNNVRNIVVGTANKSVITRRFMSRHADVPSTLMKIAPDFCSVYVIWKDRVLSVRLASKAAAPAGATPNPRLLLAPSSPQPHSLRGAMDNEDSKIRSAEHGRMLGPSLTWSDNRYNQTYEQLLLQQQQQLSAAELDRSDSRNDSFRSSSDLGDSPRSDCFSAGSSMTYSTSSMSSSGSSTSIGMDFGNRDLEAEMMRLKLELKQTTELYGTACREALLAKKKTEELHLWRIEGARELEEVINRQEAAMGTAEIQKTRFKAAIEAAQAAQRKAEEEMQRRRNAEREAVEEKTMLAIGVSFRAYSIEEIESATCKFAADVKIGEGGYGPVFKGQLDRTHVAIKVLRPDAAQGRKQFQQEVEVLSCIRHPNMVLLVGACSDYGCLVYEYMENGSLEDRLNCKNGTPPIPWNLRVKIAAEIATGLLFLHQTRPEPLVHRDLKPGNILLDRNYVAKIGDVGLARLVPPKVADMVTQYRMTAAAGTFCYIDPEYQMTGLLGIKSDVYSLGILLLQMVTAKPPMGLAHYVENAIDDGTFHEVLDPTVKDLPAEEALAFAKLALGCAEMRKKDRPDLGTVVLPELQRLSALGRQSGI